MRLTRTAIALFALVASAGAAHAATPDGARHQRGATGVFWFMHVSDSHVGANKLEAPNTVAHTTFALTEGVKIINPSFVLNSGDLQDGSGKLSNIGVPIPTSGQSQTQWDAYKNVYTGAGMKLGFYYDLPGNHDVYDDQGATFYLANSLWGSTQHKTWMDFTVTTATGEYYFFGLNSTNNYFKPFSNCCPGFLDDQIQELKDGAARHAGAKLVFVAAHHALTAPGAPSTAETPAKADIVRGILKDNKAFYLHGDVHTYKEYAEADGQLVINEIASLGKGNGSNIGVGAVDHDAFVYRATGTDAPWPFIILTAPVAQDLRDQGKNPWAYSVCKNRKDNPFRALTFSKAKPTSVTVKIGNLAPAVMAPVSGLFDPKVPVWEASVDTTSLSSGVLDVVATVEADGASNVHTVKAAFTDGDCVPLTGDAPPIDAGPEAGALVDDAGADEPDAAPVRKRDGGLEAGLSAASNDPVAGCACSTAKQARSSGLGAPFAFAAALGVALLRRRR